MREKVTFSDNVPTAVMLAGAGVPQENKAGDTEYRYFLDADRIMWVPPEVHDQIQRARAQEGDELLITKQRAKRGAPVRWTVEVIADEPPAAAELRNTTTAPSSRAPIPPQPTPAPTPQPTRNGHQQPRPQPTPAQQQPPEPWYNAPTDDQPITPADRMAGALVAAIEAAAAATEYARQRNIPLAWNAGDIRALAATLYIDASKGGAR